MCAQVHSQPRPHASTCAHTARERARACAREREREEREKRERDERERERRTRRTHLTHARTYTGVLGLRGGGEGIRKGVGAKRGKRKKGDEHQVFACVANLCLHRCARIISVLIYMRARYCVHVCVCVRACYMHACMHTYIYPSIHPSCIPPSSIHPSVERARARAHTHTHTHKQCKQAKMHT